MSIISQALLRAEQERKSGQNGQKIYPPKKRKQSGGWLAALIVLSIVIATPFATPYLSTRNNASETHLETTENAVAANAILVAQNDSSKGSAQFAMESGPVIMPGSYITQGAASIIKEDYRLSGILQDGGGFYAILNNTVVKEGSKIGNALVTSVENDAVTIQIDGQEFVIKKDF